MAVNNSSPMANVKVILIESGVTLWRHKWVALAGCWLVCLLGWGAVMRMPRHYESDARAFVDVNGLLTPLLRGLVVDTNTTQNSDYLRQTLLSRPNLEQVLHLAQLDIGKSQPEKDALIAGLANQVQVKSQGKNLFTISYVNTDPVVAKDVVESLLTIFGEKAASSSRVEMEKAHKFLDDQIAAYEVNLRAAEQRRADFQKKYANYLAEPNSGMGKLQSLRQQSVQGRLALNQAIATRDNIATQLKTIPQFFSVTSTPTVGPDGRIVAGSTAARLAQAKSLLDVMKTKYNDKHPDVIAAQKEIAKLEADLAAAPAAPEAMTASTQGPANPTYDQIRLKLVDAQTAVLVAQQRLDQINSDYNDMKVVSAEIPDIDAKAKDVDRDYEVIQKNHDALMQRRESANLSQAADDQADRTQFRIVDPPLVPLAPASPNLPLMFSLVLLIGIGVGVSLPIGLELVRATFSSAMRLRSLGLPVIGAVTFVRRPGATRGVIAKGAGVLVAASGLLVVYGALIIFSSAGDFL
jgi:polysaccharide chain length determinant protein (PEP-CTERM system associated)